MDVIVIFNGLGNQMSQYAFYLNKKELNSSTEYILMCNVHNGLELNKVFQLTLKERLRQKFLHVLYRLLCFNKLSIITTPIKKILNLCHIKVIKEGFDYTFNKGFFNTAKGITFYVGGWHSEKYFNDIKSKITDTYKFETPVDTQNSISLKEILNSNSVSLHVRRGDYMTDENIKLFGNVCTKEYFEAAINLIRNKIDKPHFFVFSNDIAWVKSNLSTHDVTHVVHNTNDQSWKDMYLMSMCKHNIISNSTFSWWAAWLNKNEHKVIVSPSRFLNDDKFSDVYPNTWIKLSNY